MKMFLLFPLILNGFVLVFYWHFLFLGPLEFMEPDLSSLPAPRPMSPEPSDTKRESITEKNRQGEKIIEQQFLLMLISLWMKDQNVILF